MAARKSRNSAKRYMMRQKIVALGDDFYIENERGERVFHIDGKVLTIRDTLVFQDIQGVNFTAVDIIPLSFVTSGNKSKRPAGVFSDKTNNLPVFQFN